MRSIEQEIENTWRSGERFDTLGDIAELYQIRPGVVESCDFPVRKAADIPVVDAKVLRRLIMETSIPGQRYLRGVHIKGRLILEGARLEGDTPLPPLKFVQCYFDNGICLQDSKLSGLSLRGSRFFLNRDNAKGDYHNNLVHINGRNAEILGDLDLSHITPMIDHRPESVKSPSFKALIEEEEIAADCSLMANFDGARIRGSVEAAFSIFAEHWKYIQIGAHGSLPYCFSMVGAQLAGELRLSPWFECHGGLQLKELQCLGEAWLTRAFISANYLGDEEHKDDNLSSLNEHKALLAQYATFCKNLSISHNIHNGQYDRRSTIVGCLDLYGCKAGTIRIEGIEVLQSPEWSKPLISKCLLRLLYVDCNQLLISSKRHLVKGHVIPPRGNGTGIEGYEYDVYMPCDVNLSNTNLKSLVLNIALSSGSSLQATALKVSKSAKIRISATAIDFSGFARIGGDLEITGNVWNVLLPDINIDGDLNTSGWMPSMDYKGYPGGTSKNKPWLQNNKNKPKLNLHNAQIRRSLKSPRPIEYSENKQYKSEDRPAALVDLSDASCRVLDDYSGRGWSDGTHFKTDRFTFESVTRTEKNKSTASYSSQAMLKLKDIIAERLKIFPDFKTPESRREYDGICYTNNHEMHFSRQRLLWLMRYVQDLTLDNPGQSNSDSSKNKIEKTGTYVDGGVFRQISTIYWKLGLVDEAKDVDEAKYRIDMNELSKKHSRYNYKIDHPIWFFSLFLLGSIISISIACNVHNGCKESLLGVFTPTNYPSLLKSEFGLWSSLSAFLALFFLWWNKSPFRQLFKRAMGHIISLFSFVYWLTFRYSLSLLRPFVTILILFSIGWWGTSYMGENGLLTTESTIVSAYVLEDINDDKYKGTIRAPYYDTLMLDASKNGESTTPFPHLTSTSAVSCKGLVDYVTYAIDSFIPLLDLDQEDRCLIRPFSKKMGDKPYRTMLSLKPWYTPLDVFIKHPTTWRIFQTIYVLLGWIVISLTIVVYTNILRRRNYHSE